MVPGIFEKIRGNSKFVIVKLDNSSLLTILNDLLHLDLVNHGIDVVIRQTLEIINGKSSYAPLEKIQNVKAYITSKSPLIVEIRTDYFMESQSKYGILTNLKQSDIEIQYIGEGFATASLFIKGVKLSSGIEANLFILSRMQPTSPGFPFRMGISIKN